MRISTARIYPRVRTTNLPTRSTLLWYQHIAILNSGGKDAGRFNNLPWIEFQAEHIIRSLGLWMSCCTRCLTDASHFRRACVLWELCLRRSHSLICILFRKMFFGWKIKLWLLSFCCVCNAVCWRGKVNLWSPLFSCNALSVWLRARGCANHCSSSSKQMLLCF